MADEVRKEVVVDIKLNQQDAETRVTKLTKTIAELKADTEKLVETNKKLAATGKENTERYQENSKGIEINKQLIKQATTERKSLIETILAEDNSIKALQLRNKELVQQRNEISTATVEGRAQIALLNKEIDENNRIINDNVSSLEKQKINIGNYASALDGVLPGISGYVKGTEAMITTSRTFIATPIGAIIGALGLALGALIAYFKGTEEGQDRLNKIMQIGGAIMGKIMNVVRDLGEALFNAASNPKQAFEDLVDFLKGQLINRLTAMAVVVEGIVNLDFKKVTNGMLQFALGVEDVLGKAESLYDELAATAELAIDQGAEVARLQKELRELERAHKKEDAEATLRISKLKQDAAHAEGAQRRRIIEEAIALEQRRADESVKLARKRLEVEEAIYAIADATIEDTDKLIAAQVAVTEAENQRYQTTLRLQRQLHTVIEEERKLRIEAYDEYLQKEHELFLAQQAKRDEARQSEEGIVKNFNQRIADDLKKRLDDEDKAEKKALKEREIIEKLKVQYTVGGLALIAKERSAARIIGNAIFQKDAINETLVNTHAAAVAAYKSLSGIPIIGPALGAAAAAAAVIYGGAQVAAITGIRFAQGGRADKKGTFEGPSHAGGGVKYIRSDGRHAIEVEGGENFYVLKKSASEEINRLSAINEAHGGRSFAVASHLNTHFAQGGMAGIMATSQANKDYQLISEIRDLRASLNHVRTVLVLQDFEAASEAKNSPIQKAQVI